MTLRLCATTSCSSRAMRARSSATARRAFSSRSRSSSTVRAASASAICWRLATIRAAPNTAAMMPPMKKTSPNAGAGVDREEDQQEGDEHRRADARAALVGVGPAGVDREQQPGERRAGVVGEVVRRVGGAERRERDAEHEDRRPPAPDERDRERERVQDGGHRGRAHRVRREHLGDAHDGEDDRRSHVQQETAAVGHGATVHLPRRPFLRLSDDLRIARTADDGPRDRP